ncbi:hypothetical protein TeGR_g6688, partial [Tetraparma gracilis]
MGYLGLLTLMLAGAAAGNLSPALLAARGLRGAVSYPPEDCLEVRFVDSYNKNSPAHASLTASVVIPYAGDWTLDVTQGTYNVQHFLGSPHLITVAPAATDPASCALETPLGRSITAGSSFEAIVETFDEVSAQHGLQSLEGFDTASDAANAVVLGAVGASSAGMSPVLHHGLVAHGGLMVLLGLYQFIQRGRIKQGYKDMLNGTDQALLTLAKATNKAQDKGKLVELDESSLGVRLNMVNVQISSLELGIAGLLLEDAPALALNAAVLLLKLGEGGGGEEG